MPSQSTYSLADTHTRSNAITDETILVTYHKFRAQYPTIVNALKCAPSTFKQLNKYFEDQQAELAKKGIKTIPPEDVWLTALYGLRVIVDPNMKPGTWKFVESSE
jgi:hypothetical protein